jgi:hypothetical protein
MREREIETLIETRISLEPHAVDDVRTFWLSFCDGDRPAGDQFLGVCIVDVTGDDANDAQLDVLLRFPLAQEGAEWLAAASRKCHRLGINPGGEMASFEITGLTPPDGVTVVKDRLLSKAELRAQGHEPMSYGEMEEAQSADAVDPHVGRVTE